MGRSGESTRGVFSGCGEYGVGGACLWGEFDDAMTTQENRLDPSLLGLPGPIYQVLVNLVRQMQEGRAVVLMPEDETFMTQAAASFSGRVASAFGGLDGARVDPPPPGGNAPAGDAQGFAGLPTSA